MKMDGKEQIYHRKDSKDDYESSFDDSFGSNSLSSCSSDLMDDDATSSSSSSSNGPLFELSELMSQLPIKRGLSKYYQGKSQTFTSLASVKSLEDLVKRERPSKKRTIKSCKSYGGGLEHHIFSPKAVISKKKNNTTRISLLSNPKNTKSGTYFTSFGIS